MTHNAERKDNLYTHTDRLTGVSPNCHPSAQGNTAAVAATQDNLPSGGEDKLLVNYRWMMNHVNHLNVNGQQYTHSNLRYNSVKGRRKRTISTPVKFITVALVARAAVKHHVNFLTFAIANNLMVKTLLPVVTEKFVIRRRGQRGKTNQCPCGVDKSHCCPPVTTMCPVPHDPHEQVNCTDTVIPPKPLTSSHNTPLTSPPSHVPQIVIIQSTSLKQSDNEKTRDTTVKTDAPSLSTTTEVSVKKNTSTLHSVKGEVMPDLPIFYISSHPLNASIISQVSNDTSKITVTRITTT